MKLFGDFLWTRTPKMGQSSTWGVPRGGHKPPGCTRGPWRAQVGCAHLGGLPPPSLPYKFSKIPKTLGVNLYQKFRHRKAL